MSWMSLVYDPALWVAEQAFLARWRHELLAPLTGDVVEIGAGTGLNLPHYGDGARLVLSEPDDGMRARLEAKLRRPAEVRPDPAERLSVADASVDAVVSTLVLCTVPDPDAALAEARRVLRPGGKLVFLEHVAGHGARLALQRAVEPLWSPLAGGCRLCRRTVEAIGRAGFELGPVRVARPLFVPPFMVPMVRGTAVRGG